jgi:hypothetical protein
MQTSHTLSPEAVQAFLDGLFQDDLHAKRVRSLADATLGVLHAGSLGVHAIGRGLATARGLTDKHAVKQVDRMLSNSGIDLETLFEHWIPHVLNDRGEVYANMDWTEFDRDGHSMLVVSVQTDHGRSTPLIWKTVTKSELKGRRNAYEDDLLLQLREHVPLDTTVTLVADRRFGDHKLYEHLRFLGFSYVIRFRANILVEHKRGEQRKAADWVGPGGRARLLRNAKVTRHGFEVPTVVCVQDRGMKSPWCLVASDPKITTAKLKKLYGKRFTIEEMFRDVKDWRFGLGMSWHRIGQPARRDRMFLLAALAQGLLILLGRAGEHAGLDRLLKTNTSKKRTLSLFRQGLLWYERIPNMPEERLRKLVSEFDRLIASHPVYSMMLVGQ